MRIDIPRELALTALDKIECENAYSNIVLDEILTKNRHKLSQKDISFISELVYGVTTWRLSLDCMLQKHSKMKVRKMASFVRNILRLGAYQIVFLDKIPKSAAVNESVNLGKKYGARSTGLINAILRKIEKSDFEEFSQIENPIERISKTTSMPEWMIEEFLKEHDLKKVEEICQNSNIRPKMSIRINSLKTTKEELIKKLEEEGIAFEEGEVKDFLYLKNKKDITNLGLYKEGYFTLQDEAAGLVPLVLHPKQEDQVLDCCSAPGGKTTYLAELMQNKGTILAWDLYETRLHFVEENGKRLGITNIKTEVKDSTVFYEKYQEAFDCVLLDVPCLGLGVIRRKPDIKWQRKREDISEIAKIQKQMLETCSQYVKKGGRLVYSTCSILKGENDEIVEAFLKEHTEFMREKMEIELPTKMKEAISTPGDLKLYPDSQKDGFFIALLIRKETV